ncbi:MAG TPA: IS66 family transposase [Gammaproteobacteria bacterium]|nr:IS66 family transposase [Gammaproteobacteria bacterium]
MDLNELIKLLTAKDAQISQLLERITNMQAQLDNLLRILYGKKSEKNPSASNDTTVNVCADSTVSKTKSTTNNPIRKKLPDALPRENICYELPISELKCDLCSNTCHKIGEEISQQLEMIPAKMFVKKHIRFKYACKNGCCVKVAPMPKQPIPKGIPGPGLLAEVVINKYQDSLPLYRQALRFERHGIDIPESTLGDWMAQSAQLLSPLVGLMHDDILRESHLYTDDTPVPVLAKGKTRKGRLWAYVSDRNNTFPCTIYDYSATRAQTAPQKFLTGFKGYLQADAYSGYNTLYQSGDVTEIGCMAHTRRKFFDIAAELTTTDSLAHDALGLIAKIYAVESRCRDMHYKKRYFFRKKYLQSLYRKLHKWLIQRQKTVIPNTPIYRAINYALNHWRALQNVFADGRLEIDNNTAERAMRVVAIGRKNWMFAGSDQAGHNAAIFYSILESAKQNGLNTFNYLSDVLAKIPNTDSSDMFRLLPYHYAK